MCPSVIEGCKWHRVFNLWGSHGESVCTLPLQWFKEMRAFCGTDLKLRLRGSTLLDDGFTELCVSVFGAVLHNSPRYGGMLIDSRHGSEWSLTEST